MAMLFSPSPVPQIPNTEPEKTKRAGHQHHDNYPLDAEAENCEDYITDRQRAAHYGLKL